MHHNSYFPPSQNAMPTPPEAPLSPEVRLEVLLALRCCEDALAHASSQASLLEEARSALLVCEQALSDASEDEMIGRPHSGRTEFSTYRSVLMDNVVTVLVEQWKTCPVKDPEMLEWFGRLSDRLRKIGQP